MLGQEDLDPGAASAAPDSFQNCAPWKRLVVISAGVVMNILLAASLFVIVFMAGLKTEPAIIGRVYPGSPAALAVPVSGADAANTEPGLRPGDRVVRIDGDPVRKSWPRPWDTEGEPSNSRFSGRGRPACDAFRSRRRSGGSRASKRSGWNRPAAGGSYRHARATRRKRAGCWLGRGLRACVLA
jgi:hypothetical protein